MIDAHRRVCIAKQRNETDRSKIWTGLTIPSEIKSLIQGGVFMPVHRETARVLNWYTFTEHGWKEYDRLFSGAPDYFDPSFQEFSVGTVQKESR